MCNLFFVLISGLDLIRAHRFAAFNSRISFDASVVSFLSEALSSCEIDELQKFWKLPSFKQNQ